MQAEEAGLCPGGCGQPLEESTAVGADENYRARILACHACTTRERAIEDRDTRGELVFVTKV